MTALPLLEHYYIILISAFSNKLGDVLFMILSICWNFLVWEVRSYHSNNTSTKLEAERLLDKITKTYWLCTSHRIHVQTQLSPSGFVIGDGFYLVYIDIRQKETDSKYHNGSSPSQEFHIKIYGWWSIQSLLTDDILIKRIPGEYKIVMTNRYSPTTTMFKTNDHFNNEIFNQNCHVACKKIISNYKENKCNGSVYFLTGNPGLGKTTTARLIALRLNAWLCLDFEDFYDFDNPIYSFEALYNYVEPNEFTPLVMVLDELEDFLFCQKVAYYDDDEKKMMNEQGVRLRNKNTKKHWSRLLDMIQQKKHVLFILTTNKPKQYFDEVDTALLREYRVTQCYQYYSNKVKCLDHYKHQD